MALDAWIFVSKRLQPACAALICLAFAQLALASCSTEAAPPGAVRVAISP
jgi:hypothetical protein